MRTFLTPLPKQMKWKSTKNGNHLDFMGNFWDFIGTFWLSCMLLFFVSELGFLSGMRIVECTFEENIPSLETCHFQKCFIVCTIRGWQGTQMSCLEDTSYIVVSNSAAVTSGMWVLLGPKISRMHHRGLHLILISCKGDVFFGKQGGAGGMNGIWRMFYDGLLSFGVH